MKESTIKIIKACKSKDPLKSLVKYYKDNYLENNDEDEMYHVIGNLISDVIKEHIEFDLTRLINSLNPNQFIAGYENDSYNKRTAYTLMNVVRFVNVKDIKDYEDRHKLETV